MYRVLTEKLKEIIWQKMPRKSSLTLVFHSPLVFGMLSKSSDLRKLVCSQGGNINEEIYNYVNTLLATTLG